MREPSAAHHLRDAFGSVSARRLRAGFPRGQIGPETMPVRGALKCAADAHQGRIGEGTADELDADRQALARAASRQRYAAPAEVIDRAREGCERRGRLVDLIE